MNHFGPVWPLSMLMIFPKALTSMRKHYEGMITEYEYIKKPPAIMRMACTWPSSHSIIMVDSMNGFVHVCTVPALQSIVNYSVPYADAQVGGFITRGMVGACSDIQR